MRDAMTDRNSFSPLPAFHVSVIRLQCSACGAEANASCDCGKPYVPALANYVRANPDASVRQIEEATGVGHGTAQRARSGVPRGTPDAVVGRDGKKYPARGPEKSSLEHGREQVTRLKEIYGDDLATYSPPPIQYDLLDQVKPVIVKMNRPTKDALTVWLSEIYRD
jgi:hypothetical protein